MLSLCNRVKNAAIFIAISALQQPTAMATAPRWLSELPNGARLMATSSANQPTKAVRLIFEYDGDQVRLVSQQPVDVALTDADIVQPHATGFFVDARDAGGQT